MATVQNTNPFLSDVVDDDLIEDEIETYASEVRVASPSEHELSLDSIAIKLIKDNFLLTALELHTELVESGRELPRLRDYFSNPGNFERTKSENTSPTLPRTSSVQTFDSLDFARYSDDGERQVDERVAVLEFELRKAQDTIKSLRAILTREAVENELSSPDHGDDVTDGNPNVKDEQIRPLEKRALNFLVNEYLLLNNNKLTSVTFAEENEDQDFEAWDDVGLNIPKPADVLHLYRDYGNHMFPKSETCEVACEAALDDEEKLKYEEMQQELEARCLSLERQIDVLTLENSSLLVQITNHNFTDVNTVTVHASTPFVTPMNTPQKQIAVKSQPDIKNSQSNSETNNLTKVPESETAEQVDKVVIVDVENKIDNNGGVKDNTDVQSNDSKIADSHVLGKLPSDRSVDSILTESRLNESTKVQVGSRIHSSDVADMTQVTRGEGDGLDAELRLDDNNRMMSAMFRQALIDITFHASHDNRIIKEVSQLSTSDREQMVFMLGRCLPHIVPNVLLAKREELIPVIVCTAALHPEAKERDKLLNILFNLIKKPDEEQRQMILTGCIAFCSHVGSTRAEAELLPQCWEQLNHKYEERKLLVAEACGALAPYLPHEMRGSLVLSMLQQMLDDKNEDVREATVKSLGLLFGFISNQDKYTQGYELLMRTLRDPSEKVLRATHTVLLPSFALWSYELGKLEHGLVNALLRQLEELVKAHPWFLVLVLSPAVSSAAELCLAHISLVNQCASLGSLGKIDPFTDEFPYLILKTALMAQKNTSSTHLPIDESRFILLVYTLQTLLPFLFLTILKSAPFISKLDAVIEEVQYIDSSRFPKSFSPLTDLCTIVGDINRLSALVYLYEEHIAQEWFEQWESFSWLVNNLIPRCVEIISGVGLTLPHVIPVLCQFFITLCRTFGRLFSDLKVKARFKDILNIPEEELDTQVLSGQTALTTCVVPVFAAGVLAAFTTESDQHQLTQFLQTVLCTLALCPAPLDSIMAAFTELSTNPLYHDLLLAVLWDGVVHTSAQVRCAAARLFQILIRALSETQLSTQVLPALVTLANDPEISVRVSTIPALGTIIENVTIREMLDKVYMQLQSFLDDPYYRDQHSLHMELIHMFGTVGPSSETKFRDDFVLPRLAAMAQANTNLGNETKKRDIALALFEAYSALSCCFLSDQLVQEVMLPGLRCLRSDMSQVAADHEEVVASMIRDFENKLETARNTERSVSGALSCPAVVVTSATPPTDDMRSRMMNRLKDTTSRAHISNIFTRKK